MSVYRAAMLVVFFGIAAAAKGQLRVVALPAPSADSTPPSDARSAAEQPLLMSPGHYVLPAPYDAAYWSPHIRPFPDYSTSRESLRRRVYGSSRLRHSFGPTYYAPYFADAEAAYNQGRYDAQREYLWYIASQRAGRLLNQYAAQFDEAVRFFHDGHYEQALVNLLGAADKNQDAAAPRLHAGHALFALGRYPEAVTMLERAFELSPSLAYRTYDLRDEYGRREDFDAQLSALKQYVVQKPNDASALTMLGYVTYFTQGPSAADPALRRAARLNPTSYFIPKLRAVSGQAASTLPQSQSGDEQLRKRKAPASRRRADSRNDLLQACAR